MNSIQWSKRAFKQLRRLPAKDSKQIIGEVALLQHFPECRNVKKLVNHQYGYRLRVGKYRVMFDYESEIRVVSVEEVKKRDKSTY